MENYLSDISLMTYLMVFLGGVATSLTPCVFPLIPILVGVIGASGQKSRGRNFLLSFSYVLGMGCTFSILGLFAALTGRLFGQVQSSSLAHIVVGGVIILFALALLDVISLPVFFLSRAGAGKVIKKASMPAVFFMGLVSGFVALPCAAAVLGALLAYVASTQNVFFGFSLLFTFALGVGMLLMIVGTFTGIVSGLPKLQKWIPVVQKVLAFAMLILGEYYIFKAGMLSI